MRLGDLDALKKDLFIKFGNQLPNGLSDEIDNAPTVEPEVYLNGKDYNLYLEGYKQAKKDFERPIGEWKLSAISEIGKDWYKCSVCGRQIHTVEKMLKEYPFCHCGAYMRKGGSE